MAGDGGFGRRIAAVRRHADLRALIDSVVPLFGQTMPRGRCPFHRSSTKSLRVDEARGRWWCVICGANGCAVTFVRDFFGLGHVTALQRLEAEYGLAMAPEVENARAGQTCRPMGSVRMGRSLVAGSVAGRDELRGYLRAEGVPDAVLGEAWLQSLHFNPSAARAAWGPRGSASAVPRAPAVLGIVRRSSINADGKVWARPIGVHATYLDPALDRSLGHPERSMPARSIYGDGWRGGILLGSYRPKAPLYVGVRVEQVLATIAADGAEGDACGLAVLNHRNLRGMIGEDRAGAIALWKAGQVERSGTSFPHGGPVIGVIEPFVNSICGAFDPLTGRFRGVPVVERPKGPVVLRVISPEEREAHTAAAFVTMWRRAGCHDVRTVEGRGCRP